MNPTELKSTIDAHKLWIISEGRDGKWANLSRANLSRSNLFGANLSRADLSGAILSHTNLVQLQIGNHPIVYQPETGLVKIGCVEMKLSELLKNEKYREIGEKNQYSEREIELYGFYLQTIIKIEVVRGK